MGKNNNMERDLLKEKLHEVIFEADTPLGKTFDIALLIIISLSVLIVMLESINYIQIKYHTFFLILEWIFTIIFTIEYILRLYSVYRPMKYATSFFGIIDLLAIIPTYLSFFISGSQTLLVIRALRLLRIFRIFKLGHFLKEGDLIMSALRRSRAKITVFLTAVILLVIIIGSVMYLIEGGAGSGFSSIPRSIYWAIVTLTTVGYGDITPATDIGQFLSAVVMILGYSMLAVPTGIVSAELASGDKPRNNTQSCRYCGKEGHDDDALFCKFCGEKLNED